MMNYNEKYSFITDMTTESNPRLFFRRAIALLITFYTSYLFFHFVVLNLFIINNILVIFASLWAGHIFLNIFALCIWKNRTFGDFIVRIKYIGFRRNIKQAYQIAMRSFFTTTLFYGFVFFTYLTGWSIGAIITSLVITIGLNYCKFNKSNLLLIDWLTGSLALKK
ncbi:hypothetical protein [Polaribacter sp.]|uniref:hypothetical protein n=1 Tax=Polaribacter sp. TaxID=1920175 RepID=UPI003F6C0D07